MPRQACVSALANTGNDTRAIPGLDVAQEHRIYVRYNELAPERFKDFGGRGVLRWAGAWIVSAEHIGRLAHRLHPKRYLDPDDAT